MTEKILFLGDSHIIPVRSAFPYLTPSSKVAGGPLPLGRGWIKNFHTDDAAHFQMVVPEAQLHGNAQWGKIVAKEVWRALQKLSGEN